MLLVRWCEHASSIFVSFFPIQLAWICSPPTQLMKLNGINGTAIYYISNSIEIIHTHTHSDTGSMKYWLLFCQQTAMLCGQMTQLVEWVLLNLPRLTLLYESLLDICIFCQTFEYIHIFLETPLFSQFVKNTQYQSVINQIQWILTQQQQ